MSNASQAGLYYVKEATFGAGPPAATAFKAIRFTSEGLKQTMGFEQSDEISPDRATLGVLRTSLAAGGPVGFELSYGTYDDWFAAALGGTWAIAGGGVGIDRLENAGVKTGNSFVIEKKFSDITEFLSYHGAMVNTMSLDIPAQGKITGSFEFLALNEAAAGATIATVTTPIAATSTPIVNSIDNISAVTEGGSAFTGCIDRISLQFNNNLRTKNCVGVVGAADVGYGQMQITGTFRAHYESRTLYEKKLNQTASSIGWTITDALGNAYIFLVPEIKYTDGQVVAGGNNQDVIADLSFTAIKDPSLAVMFRLDRNPA